MKIKINTLTGSLVGAISSLGALLAPLAQAQFQGPVKIGKFCLCKAYNPDYTSGNCQKGSHIGVRSLFIESSIDCADLDLGIVPAFPGQGELEGEVVLDSCSYEASTDDVFDDLPNQYCQ